MSSLISTSSFSDENAYADATSKKEARKNSRPDEERWVPAIAFVGAFHGENQKSSLSSSCDIGGPGGVGNDAGVLVPCTQSGPIGRGIVHSEIIPGSNPVAFEYVLDVPGLPTAASAPTPFRSASDGKELGVWPGVGVDFHLMSPRIVELPFNLGPRAFVNAEVMAVFPPSRATANEGSLQGLTFPESLALTDVPTNSIGGGGSETTSRPSTFEFGAQFGLAFPLDILNRRVRIKPSFGWLHYRVEVNGRVLGIIKDDVNGLPPGGPIGPKVAGNRSTEVTSSGTYGANSRIIDLQDSASREINAIGPGLEIELESGRFGPIGAAVFASASGYKVLSDRTFKLSKSKFFANGTLPNGTPDPTKDGLLADTYRASWKHEIAPWVYRFKLGLRFHYVGEQ